MSSESRNLGGNETFSNRFFERLLVAVGFVFVCSIFTSIRADDALPVGEVDTVEGVASPETDPHSDAHRISELRETIEEDREQLTSLETEVDNPQGEYALAEAAFRELKSDLERETENLENARQATDTARVRTLELEIASIERKRRLAEARFELAIEDRRTLRDQIQTLRSKLKKDQAALDDLTGENDPGVDASDDTTRSDETDLSEKTVDKTQLESRAADEEKKAESDDEKPSSEDSLKDDETEDEEIVEAEHEADEKELEADEAQRETQSLADRIADLQKLIAQEQKELALGRKKIDLAESAQFALTTEIAKRQSENADTTELQELRVDASDASRRLILARSEVNAIVERLNDHRAELAMLQSEHIVALHEADSKRQEADAAENRLESLRNPFAPRNVLQWVLDHGIRLIAIVMGMFLLNRIAGFFSHRSISLVSAGTSRGTKIERENRARTLVGVFQNAATVAIFITGFLMLLEEVGANVTVLMGGVAVIGLAVAFGAQNLIKDYFYGFVMLLENQYMLNDSIRIGTLTGQVERITLRMTVLRDSNGVVHFVPNGTIESVSNETHGWSRAVCEVAIGYDEDLDHVLNVLSEIGTSLKADQHFGALMMESPSMPAIETLGDSSIRLKTSVKTLPNKHSAVKQEWLRRIRARFAELGIQPAYPQQRVRFESESIDAVQSIKLGNRSAA